MDAANDLKKLKLILHDPLTALSDLRREMNYCKALYKETKDKGEKQKILGHVRGLEEEVRTVSKSSAAISCKRVSGSRPPRERKLRLALQDLKSRTSSYRGQFYILAWGIDARLDDIKKHNLVERFCKVVVEAGLAPKDEALLVALLSQ